MRCGLAPIRAFGNRDDVGVVGPSSDPVDPRESDVDVACFQELQQVWKTGWSTQIGLSSQEMVEDNRELTTPRCVVKGVEPREQCHPPRCTTHRHELLARPFQALARAVDPFADIGSDADTTARSIVAGSLSDVFSSMIGAPRPLAPSFFIPSSRQLCQCRSRSTGSADPVDVQRSMSAAMSSISAGSSL